VKITPEVIARTALGLLTDAGLDGLTMRLVAKELGVQAPTLYWHVKNKQELLDAMADLMFAEAAEGLEAPARGETWEAWAAARVGRLRRTMLRYRDGARVFAGSFNSHPAMLRTVELTLRTLVDAGFTLDTAARAFPTVLHYTVGFTIEEQARASADYGAQNPYANRTLTTLIDPAQHPLALAAADRLLEVDSDASFDYGLRIIFAGMRAELLGGYPGAAQP
jgi:TetR/AcrR family tetracycline transcriptional repressor